MRIYTAIDRALTAHGLTVRGGFAPEPGDGVPPLGDGRPAAAVVLVGNVAAQMWRHFAPYAQNGSDALDRWTERVVAPIAAAFGARPAYPFDMPALPFQRWAMKAEAVHPSPLGILIHPDHGLWHAYRAALLFDEPVDLPRRTEGASPCASCATKPCLAACPVGAFTGSDYAVAVCAAHLDSAAGVDCSNLGCRARAACPVGRPYPDEQIRFHMAAFRRAVSLR